jgi:hypothetical protein
MITINSLMRVTAEEGLKDYQGMKNAIAAWINAVTIQVPNIVQLNNTEPRVKL